MPSNRTRVVILGAAGRDFHNFNTVYRNDERYEVVAFTATQIPNIEGRRYPPELAGRLYPAGIPIFSEDELPRIAADLEVDQAVFSYSDVSFQYVMEKATFANALGIDFVLLGTRLTMLKSRVPVVAVLAVRTGSGKSQTSRKVCRLLRESGVRVVAVRHPMPYGDLVRQKVQRFASLDDLTSHECTLEEMEEYEPHIAAGGVVYAGVDYGAILAEAEKEADVIVWDGGNNDASFYKPDLMITVVDPHRPGHELTYYPGAQNVRLADVVVINKVESAIPENVDRVRQNVRHVNPRAVVIEGASPISVEDEDAIGGKRCLVIEDGPTVTHGDMTYGAGTLAARKFEAKSIVDPRPYAVGSIADTYRKYPATGPILPAMGYGAQQIADLAATIDCAECDVVVIGTPVDLRRVVKFNKPSVRVRYELAEIAKPDLRDVLAKFLAARGLGGGGGAKGAAAPGEARP